MSKVKLIDTISNTPLKFRVKILPISALKRN